MRLAAAQRWPAFEKADASVHSTARSRSASSQTTSAFFPPSSITVFARRRPAASAIARPVEAEPVKLTRSTRVSSTSGIPASAPSPWTTFSTPGGRPASRQSRPSHHADAGACSDGFSTEPLPQRIEGNAFQATLGRGVLKEMRSAATPTGRRSVSTVRCGIDAVVVRPYERRPSPATKKPISTEASVSPSASASDLPVSAATSSLASSRRSRRSSAIARTTFPRSTAVRSPHSTCAARAAATAAAASSAPERATRQRCSPSAGRALTSHPPSAAGRSSPATRFGTRAGITRPSRPLRSKSELLTAQILGLNLLAPATPTALPPGAVLAQW